VCNLCTQATEQGWVLIAHNNESRTFRYDEVGRQLRFDFNHKAKATVMVNNIVNGVQVSETSMPIEKLLALHAAKWVNAAKCGYLFKRSRTLYAGGQTLYGWYSAKHHEYHEASIYSTPDGKEVMVTSVTNTPHHCGLGYDDVVSVGPVVKRWRSVPALKKKEWYASTGNYIFSQITSSTTSQNVYNYSIINDWYKNSLLEKTKVKT
jgi:hypothetical protein